MTVFKKFLISTIGLFLLWSFPSAHAINLGINSNMNSLQLNAPNTSLNTTFSDDVNNAVDSFGTSGNSTLQNEVNSGMFGETKSLSQEIDEASKNAPKTPIPSLFAEGGGCTFDAGSGSVSCKPGILGSACEVVMAGLRSEKNEGGAVNPRSLTCTEFVDPIPARFMNGYKEGGTYCIQQTEIASGGNKDNVNTYKFTNKYDGNTYCIGLLHKTGDGDLTPILGFVMFIYNLMQPLLIIGGVIALVVAGIFIMYAPGGEGDTIKKGKEMLIRIISGFLLFFMIKVFLSTINGNFFDSTSTGSSTSTESTIPAGEATGAGSGADTGTGFTGDAITTP